MDEQRDESPNEQPDRELEATSDPLPSVVGLGASAGGLKALRDFFGGLPENPGIPFIVVVHLSPEHESHLAELLQPHCPLPVQQVAETTPIEPDRVYVIPPDANLDAIDTHLRLSELEELPRDRATVDHFFRTLADTHDGRAIGIVLTGTGSDGTLGLRRIKEAGGVTLAQDPDEAEYDGMPRSAIAAGAVDRVLPVQRLAEEVVRLARLEPSVPVRVEGDDLEDDQGRVLQKIFAQVRAHTGHDFSPYRRATIVRRLQRRMQLQYVENLESYLQRLRESSQETHELFEDLLITVTEFFRDEKVFERLEKNVIPKLFEGKTSEDRIRVWSVGCATGEEAYSLAMLLLEEAERQEERPQLQVFASDLQERSLTLAREGVYPAEIAADVSPERLQRFFASENGHYRIRREVREMVVFAPHNLLGDPPFSHQDLVVCRNVLIYLQRDVQQDVVRLLHYALEPDGRLVLGTSETVDRGELFMIEDKQASVYRRRNVPTEEPALPILSATPRIHGFEGGAAEGDRPSRRRAPTEGYGAMHARIVERYAPPSVMINPDHQVVHMSANAGRYLLIQGGEPTRQAFKLFREPLDVELRAALHAVERADEAVRSVPVEVRLDGETKQVELHVTPVRDDHMQGFVLVVFHELPEQSSGTAGSQQDEAPEPSGSESATLREMEAEVDLYRQRLQATIEEYESSREEMQASNEELKSANEELRSTMEELETSKEELQSMNEELTTVSQENRHRVEELTQVTNDLDNLLTSTEIATLFLDRQLRIVRFTPAVGQLFNIRHTDRGRPLTDLTHNLNYHDLPTDAGRVLERLERMEREVPGHDDRWFLTRLLPYRAGDDRIEGVVVTFIDITDRKKAERSVERNRQLLQTVIDSSPDAITVMRGSDLRIMMANAAYEAISPGRPVVGRTLDEVWSELEYDFTSICRRVLETGETHHAEDERFEIRRSAGEPADEAWFTWWLIPVDLPGESDKGLLNTAHDVTDRVRAQRALREAHDMLEQRVAERTRELVEQRTRLRQLTHELASAEHRERRRLAALLHDDLQQQLVALKMRLTAAAPKARSQAVREALDKGTELVEKAMRSSRTLTRELRPPVLYEAGLAAALGWLADDMAERHGLSVTVDADDLRTVLQEDIRAMLFESVRELLFNVIKHADTQRATVTVRETEDQIHVTVSDSGKGFDVAAAERSDDVSGLGLFGARERIEVAGGGMDILSTPREGTEITLWLPLEIARDTGATQTPSAGRASTPRGAHTRTEAGSESRPRVLVVDDHAIVREGLVNLIASDDRIQVVGEAADGVEALHAVEELQPDVVLMDINMPRLNGIDATRQISERWPGVSVIGLSVQDDAATKQSMLDAGAADFVSKNDDAETLIRAAVTARGDE